MASTKKKTKNKRTKSKSASGKKLKAAARSKRATKPDRPKRTSKKRKAATNTAVARAARNRRAGIVELPLETEPSSVDAISGRLSGDLQGLSQVEQADSESVDELGEEGNLFEASAVEGVEEADNAEGKEVHTHEVPEDDVPKEYLDDQ